MSHPASKLRSIRRGIEAANEKSRPPDEVPIRDAFWGELIELFQKHYGPEATTAFFTDYCINHSIRHPMSDEERKEARDAYSVHIIRELNDHDCTRQALLDICLKYGVDPISG